MANQTSGVSASIVGFIKTTITGGLMFLLPVVVIAFILGHAMSLAAKITTPITKLLPASINGIGVASLIAVLALVAVSFLAGLIARTRGGRFIKGLIENSVLAGIPQYQFVKSMAQGLARIESAEGISPALVHVDGGWQIGYLLEALDEHWVAVFIPQAPTPMAGNLIYMPNDRVRPLNITMMQAMAIIKRMGVGSSEILHCAELGQVETH